MSVYEHLIYADETESPSTVYMLIPAGVKSNTIDPGRLMYFSEGALSCKDSGSIKKYYTYMNASRIRRLVGISGLFMRGLCNFSSELRQDIVVIDTEGIFVKVRQAYDNEASVAWVIDTELIEE